MTIGECVGLDKDHGRAMANRFILLSFSHDGMQDPTAQKSFIENIWSYRVIGDIEYLWLYQASRKIIPDGYTTSLLQTKC